VNRRFNAAFPKLSGSAVALTLAMAGTVVSTEAAPTSLNWVQSSATQAPPGRQLAVMSYDSIRGVTVLFGGSNAQIGSAGPQPPNFSDTWEWDGAAWTQRIPTVSPPGLVTATMAYDSGRGVSVLFGGSPTSGPASSATWEWDGTTWIQRQPAVAPPARVWAAMVYDSFRGRTVLFGGSASAGLAGDTWEWDGTSWIQLFPSSSPSPRFGATMAFDSIRNRTVLFGGRDVNGRLNDTWEWDGINWTQGHSSSVPYPRSFTSMVFDKHVGRTILFGGDYLRPYALGPSNDTWEWDGSSWTQDWTASDPTARLGESMAYDSARGRSVLFGGTYGSNPQVFPDDTWELGTGIVTPAGNPDLSLANVGPTFTNVQVGSTSYPAGIILSSTGTGPLVVASITTTGDFAISRNDCPSANNPLAAGYSCFLLVTFEPTGPGDRSGALLVTDNGPGGSQSLALNGTGIDADLAFAGVPGGITLVATSASGAIVTYTAPTATDEAGDSPAPGVSCAPASGSTFAVGTTTVTCTASSADDSPAAVSATFAVTVLVDLNLAASVSPSTATTGTLVSGKVSLTNAGTASRTVTVILTFTFDSPGGATTVSRTKATVKLNAGQTATRTLTFKVSKSAWRGTYAFSSTASDVTGTVSSSATFTVS
jgi:hypothetical protein